MVAEALLASWRDTPTRDWTVVSVKDDWSRVFPDP